MAITTSGTALSAPLTAVRWLVLDTEYTSDHECLQIALRVADGLENAALIDELCLLPGGKAPTAKAVRAYRRRMRQQDHPGFEEELDDASIELHLQKSKRFVSIAESLVRHMDEGVVVAHNFAGADRHVLRREFRRLGLTTPAPLSICTMELARRLIPQSPSGDIGYSQDSLGVLLGVPFRHGLRHSAAGDTHHLCDVWMAMLRRIELSPSGVVTLGDLLWLQHAPSEVLAPLHEEVLYAR